MSNQSAQSPDEPQVVQFAVAVVSAKAFGGYRRTTEDDITSAGGKVPQTAILTKGGKHIFPPERLNKFEAIKKALMRELSKFGVRSFGSGSAIAFHVRELPVAEQLLKQAEKDYNAAIQELAANYDVWLEEYIAAQQPVAQDIIRKSAWKKDEAVSKFGFSYDIFLPSPLGEDSSVESMATKLHSQLYEEVADAAKVAYNKTYCPEDSSGVRHVRRVGQRAKSPIKVCMEKMERLSFLSPNIMGAVKMIGYVLGKTPDAGFIEDSLVDLCHTRLLGLVQLMTNPDKFAAVAEAVHRSQTPEAVIDRYCGVVQAEVADVAADAETTEVAVEMADAVEIAADAEADPAEAGEVPAAVDVPPVQVAGVAANAEVAAVPSSPDVATPRPEAAPVVQPAAPAAAAPARPAAPSAASLPRTPAGSRARVAPRAVHF